VKKIIDIVRTLSPEFKTMGPNIVEQYITMFYPLIGRKVFGSLYHLAMAYLTCHKMKMNGLGDNKYGTVDEAHRFSSISVGNESVSFNNAAAASTAIDSEYLSTSYGRQFLDIKRRVVIPITSGGTRI
jgi:hypothetical protein